MVFPVHRVDFAEWPHWFLRYERFGGRSSVHRATLGEMRDVWTSLHQGTNKWRVHDGNYG
jgi:hypothetical protein